MAIERKDRSFELIFDQVSMDNVPADYILEIKITLTDGSDIILSKEELYKIEGGQNILASVMHDDVENVSVKLDYEAIKVDVLGGVKGYLGKHFDDK